MGIDLGQSNDIMAIVFRRGDSTFVFHIGAIPESEWISPKNFKLLPGCKARQTFCRWAVCGLRARSGDILQLPTFRIGGRRYTTRAAFDWWNKELER